MAIKTKVSLNGIAMLTKLGISKKETDFLLANDVKVVLTAKAVSFIHHIVAGSSVAISLDILHRLQAGTLPTLERITLGSEINKAIDDIRLGLKEFHGYQKVAPSDFSPNEDAAIQTYQYVPQYEGGVTGHAAGPAWNKLSPVQSLPPVSKTLMVKGEVQPVIMGLDLASDGIGAAVVAVSAAQAPGQDDEWGVFAQSMKNSPTVPLRSATRLYQPVNGTSGGSRYFLVAASPTMRVAARYKGHTLSVRVEGPKFADFSAKAQAAGFTLHQDQIFGYASIHLDVGDDLNLAKKTLGALLLALSDTDFRTPYPALEKVKEAS